ncbi:MAG: hypothetical protein U1E17_09245 [Geminicoccaceae bacterium]
MSTGRNFRRDPARDRFVQLTARHSVATPANWQKGEDVIVVTLDLGQAKQRFAKERHQLKPYLRTTPIPAPEARRRAGADAPLSPARHASRLTTRQDGLPRGMPRRQALLLADAFRFAAGAHATSGAQGAAQEPTSTTWPRWQAWCRRHGRRRPGRRSWRPCCTTRSRMRASPRPRSPSASGRAWPDRARMLRRYGPAQGGAAPPPPDRAGAAQVAGCPKLVKLADHLEPALHGGSPPAGWPAAWRRGLSRRHARAVRGPQGRQCAARYPVSWPRPSGPRPRSALAMRRRPAWRPTSRSARDRRARALWSRQHRGPALDRGGARQAGF